MRRIAWLAVAAALAVVAIVAPEPEAVEEPAAFATRGGTDVGGFSGVWYCPVSVATLERETVLTVAAAERATAAFTFPNPVPGEEAEEARLSLTGPGGSSVLVSDIALRGDAPGFVEFTTRRSAAFSEVIEGDRRSGDACLDAAPKVWYLVGGSTGEGESLTLRLFNPFPEPAKMQILGFSEIGIEPLPEIQSVTVSARSWRDFPLGDTLRFRDALAFTVTADEGLAFPAVTIGDQVDDATWPGTRLAPAWEFPVTRTAGLVPRLVVANPGEAELTAAIDVFTADGGVEEALSVSLPGATPTVVPLDGLADVPFGVRLRASGPVAAALVASGGAGLAGTVGRAAAAERWMVPGGETNAEGVATIWLLNSGESPATVTVQPLGVGLVASKLIVPSRTLRQVIADPEANAYLVDSQSPITVGWSTEAPNGVAYSSGVPVSDQ